MLLIALLMVVLFLLSGSALVASLMLTRRRRLDMEHRIRLAAAAPSLPEDQLDIWRQAHSHKFNARLRRVFSIGHSRIWGMKSSGLRLLVVAATSGALIFLVTNVGFGWSPWLAGLLSLAVAFILPRAILLRQQKAAEQQFSEFFPDTVVAISRMLRAGLPISTAVRAVSRESPPPVNTVFSTISDQVEIGTPIEDALDVSSQEIGLPDFRFFTMAVVLQHLTGGNLAATLEILADIVRRRRAVRMKARATTAEIRVSGYVLAGLPFLIIGALLVIQPGYLSPLITDPRGHIILIMAAGGLLAAGLTMRQMMRSVTSI